MRHIGFTGRSTSLTLPQASALAELIEARRGATLHHGDCVGADQAAHTFAGANRLKRTVHPPDKDGPYRAWCQGEDMREPKPFITRNHDIVDECEELLACVAGPERSYPRAGEWATVRYARKQSKPVTIVWPDGTVTIEP